MAKTSVIIPNWNGIKSIGECLDSLIKQSIDVDIIVVENGSVDGSLEYIKTNYPSVMLVVNEKNLGFAGGVNSGIKKAFEIGSKYIALFNNDAVADRNWIRNLEMCLDGDDSIGIATCKLMEPDGSHLDSTGDFYTTWGLAFPRGRNEIDEKKYDKSTLVFGASGGASIYRAKMLKEIGLFDEDFFAYYEDVDLSFRAQLAGWKVAYAPTSIAYHAYGTTSEKIKGFTTYQTLKNVPWLYWKNVPTRYLFSVGWRLGLSYLGFIMSATSRGQGWYAFKGFLISLLYLPKKLVQRISIQSNKRVKDKYIWTIMVHDLPPNAYKLRRLRNSWWKLKGKHE